MILEPISTKIISVRIIGISPLIFPGLNFTKWLKAHMTDDGHFGIPTAAVKHALVSAADQIHELTKED